MPHHTDLPPTPARRSRTPLPEPGRPKYTTEAVDRICSIIREDGLSESRAALLAGVNSATLRQWQSRYPIFRERLEQARAEFQQARLEKIREACGREGAVDWRAQAYLLEKSHLPTGSPETEPQAETAGLAPLLTVSPEQLALLQQRRLAALNRLQP